MVRKKKRQKGRRTVKKERKVVRRVLPKKKTAHKKPVHKHPKTKLKKVAKKKTTHKKSNLPKKKSLPKKQNHHSLSGIRKYFSSILHHKKKDSSDKKEENHHAPSKTHGEVLKQSTSFNPKIVKVIDSYSFHSGDVLVNVTIGKAENDFASLYKISIPHVSDATKIILEKIRQELISTVNLGMINISSDAKSSISMEKKFEFTIKELIRKYFPDVNERKAKILTTCVVQRSLGLGDLENLLGDKHLEEIAINSSDEPVWVYHRRWGWLKTTIIIGSEDQTRHYATTIGRKVGRQVNVLEPLMDAHLKTGDRVNATLMPISVRGNTLTFRKFATKPWTITDMLSNNTISYEASALIWEAIQYELSVLIAGGTASGKTSFLNALSNFFPPNQRIISIEDTRELQLPTFLHWVPLSTRLPNAEGKGDVTMLNLLVNSLRMRPDRIIVGEIRRQKEAEVLFEAIHTGHSVYATVHADSADEAVTRLTSPPINISKSLLPALNLIVVQSRNRRTGARSTFQIAETLPGGTPNVLMQHDLQKKKLVRKGESNSFFKALNLYTGITKKELNVHLKEKSNVLKWLVKKNINDVDDVGKVMAQYYTDPSKLLKTVSRR